MFRLKKIPDFLLIVFFADMATVMLSIMVWGDFPDTNPATVALVNTAITWMAIKASVYLAVLVAYNVCEKHRNTIENISAILIILYAVFVFYNLSQMEIGVPVAGVPVVFNATDILKF